MTGHFRLLLLVPGMVCLNISSFLSVFGVRAHHCPSHDCELHAQRVLSFGHFSVQSFIALHCLWLHGVATVCSICQEFETIAERALQEVATTEELMEMIDYIEEARTNGMRKLNERVVVSQL